MGWPMPEGSECPICGMRAMTTSAEPVEERVAGRLYSIPGIARNRCNSCGEEFFRAGQSDEVRRRANDLARADTARLGPDEIRRLRLDLGLTQSALEGCLGVTAGTVGRWERGNVLQNATADRLMRVMRQHPEVTAEIGCVARESRGPYRKRE